MSERQEDGMRQAMAMAAALAATVGLIGCVEPASSPQVAVQTRPLAPADEALAQAAVSQGLRDPSSAQFRDLTSYATSAGDRIVCGEINATNGFGGYVGFQPFYVRLSGEAVASVQSSFVAVNACGQAASGTIILARNVLTPL